MACFILGPNVPPRVVKRHVCSLPLPKSQTFYLDIREQSQRLNKSILWHLWRAVWIPRSWKTPLLESYPSIWATRQQPSILKGPSIAAGGDEEWGVREENDGGNIMHFYHLEPVWPFSSDLWPLASTRHFLPASCYSLDIFSFSDHSL